MAPTARIAQVLIYSGSTTSDGTTDRSERRRAVVISALRIQIHLDPWVTAANGVLLVAPYLRREMTRAEATLDG